MALTIHTRRQIFYTLVALFIIIGGGVVFYAQGWRLDFATWHFEKVGGIYVRPYPENSSIYLDGKPIQNQAGFLSAGTLISDLLPRTYNISLKSAGYDDWQENAAVAPALVTQFKYAVLVPTDGTPVTSSTRAATLQTIARLQPTSAGIDPFDANQKIITAQNKIAIFNIAAATTTANATLPGKNISARWITPSLIGALQANGELYLYNAADGSESTAVTKLADDVKNFATAEDGSMLAALEKDSLEVFTLSGGSDYYRFNIPDIADAQNLIWYKDNTHLFVIYSNRVAFLDIADSGLVNFTIVAHGTKPAYDPSTNTLYLIDQSGNLVAYSFPN
jgi:hypothetical protein